MGSVLTWDIDLGIDSPLIVYDQECHAQEKFIEDEHRKILNNLVLRNQTYIFDPSNELQVPDSSINDCMMADPSSRIEIELFDQKKACVRLERYTEDVSTIIKLEDLHCFSASNIFNNELETYVQVYNYNENNILSKDHLKTINKIGHKIKYEFSFES